MLTLYEVDKSSTKTIRVSNGMRDLFEFNIEFYHNDNMLFPDFGLEYPYKFRATDFILKTNEKTTNRKYQKILKVENQPKKVETGELLLYFNNNKLYLLETYNIKPQLGVVVDEGDNDFIVSYIDTHYKRTVKTSKEDYKIIKEFNLNKIFNLTILVKVGYFNQINDIYYTDDCIIKNEMLL